MPQARKLLLTSNRKSEASADFPAILALLKKHCDLLMVEGEADESGLGAIEPQVLKEVEMWIAIGGDGTLNAVVNAAMRLSSRERPRICYVPSGTGNDFARTVGLDPEKPLELLESAFSASARFVPMAVGRCNERYFMNVASGGVFATVTPDTSGPMKKIAGRWSYLFRGIGKVMAREPFAIGVDGKNPETAIGFTVANARYAGGGIQVTPDANPFVPKLEYMQVPDLETKELLALGLELQKDEPDTSPWRMREMSVEKLRLDFEHAVPINLDGEQICVESAEFTVVPEAIQIFIQSE